MYSVIFECSFCEEAFCEGDIYRKGDVEFFHLILTSSNFLEAYENAKDYAFDHYPMCDVSIYSITKLRCSDG